MSPVPMEPERCRSGTAPDATAEPRDDASPALTPDRPEVIWCSRIAIAARAVLSSYVSPYPVAWLRHSRSVWDVPSPGVMSVGTLRSAPTPVVSP